jgi:hypothetical protein
MAKPPKLENWPKTPPPAPSAMWSYVTRCSTEVLWHCDLLKEQLRAIGVEPVPRPTLSKDWKL